MTSLDTACDARPGRPRPAKRRVGRTCLAVALSLAAASAGSAPNVPDPADTAAQVIARTNQLRRSEGLAALAADPALTAAAQAFARHQAATDRYGHRADGRSPAERAQRAGYETCKIAENIGFQMSTAGFTSAELAGDLVDAWAQSAGHRRNLLDPEVVDIGVAVGHSPRTNRYYAVQLFGRPMRLALRYRIVNDTSSAIAYAIGSRRHLLNPRSVATHVECNGDRLRVGRSPSAIDGDGEGIVPTQDASYVVRRSGAGLRLFKE